MNRQPIMFIIATFIAALNATPGQAAVDNKCVKDCSRRGHLYEHCIAECSYGASDDIRNMPQPKFLPMPEPLPSTLPKAKVTPDSESHAPRALLDGRCLKDCRRDGYSYGLCKRQCSY